MNTPHTKNKREHTRFRGETPPLASRHSFTSSVLPFAPIGFEVLAEVREQYSLMRDEDGTHYLVVLIKTKSHEPEIYQRWVELPNYEKLLVKLFPSRLKYLAGRTLDEETRKYRNP
ncbi:hypothetical protein [Paraburkholderia tropica]|uniref:hypothetical protein n=1 Tax=Paraburkholderia tropica TaxID=92647 RepID=UPI002AB68683|nr:hypothetical protein [Paraburkholderia tropica]